LVNELYAAFDDLDADAWTASKKALRREVKRYMAARDKPRIKAEVDALEK